MHRFWMVKVVLVAALATLAVGTGGASAATRADADASEAYFFAGDGVTRLHADILRPKGLAADVKTPVVLTVSPYTNHNGQTTDVDPTGTGPSSRFFDFLDVTGLLTKGYTYVMVDLPGFGGSGGCNDWGGLREQEAVRAAVEWAASQMWSTGKVAMLGKSYDGWTGLMAMAQQPHGLAAVVSMEPVFSGYRYLWMNGIRHPLNWPATVAEFQAFDAKPGRPTEPEYLANGAPEVWCYPVNTGGAAADDDESGPYWKERNLIPTALGKTTPIFLTQGFLEYNTLPDGAFQYFNTLPGKQNRAWFGQWDHCRPWESGDACGAASGGGGKALALGRPTFAAEVMRFLDKHLKGIQPDVVDPKVVVEDESGKFRGEDAWPPKDADLYATDLRTGTYKDDGNESAVSPNATDGLWTVSPPLDHTVWMAGEPVVTAGVDGLPNTSISAAVYDVAPNGKALLMSRGVSLLRGVGQRTVSYTMFGQDWKVLPQHRIAVLLGDADTNMFQTVPTNSDVTVRWANIKLPFLSTDRTAFGEGVATPRLKQFQGTAFTFPSGVLPGAQADFNLPGPLQPPAG
jgi:predicted acyl esterase